MLEYGFPRLRAELWIREIWLILQVLCKHVVAQIQQ